MAFHVFHDYEVAAIDFFNCVDSYNVRVIQRRRRLGLLKEAPARVRVLMDCSRKKFDGYGAAEFCIFGFVDFAHAAAADLWTQPVMKKHLWRPRRAHKFSCP